MSASIMHGAAGARRQSLQGPLLGGWLALAVVLGARPVQAQSDEGLASIVIVNATRHTLNYQFRWGSEPWRKAKITPDGFNVHYIPVDRRGDAPSHSMRFDSIGGDGQTTHKTYRLEFYRTDDANRGKPYYLRYVRGKPNHLDLYEPTDEEEREWFGSFRYDYDLQKWTTIEPTAWSRP